MTREERKRYNRRQFAVRLFIFIVGAALFVGAMVGAGYLADAVVALTCPC